MTYVCMAYVCMTFVRMAYVRMAFVRMVFVRMAFVRMAYLRMAYVRMAYEASGSDLYELYSVFFPFGCIDVGLISIWSWDIPCDSNGIYAIVLHYCY